MLDSIRKQTGSLVVKALLGLLVIAFALWGVGDIFQGPQDQAVADVGGVGIHASALQAEYTTMVENFRRRFGFDAEQARALGALDGALDRLVNREVVRQEAAAIGIGASDEDVLRAIEDNDAFHNLAGRFDKAIYTGLLYRNRLTPEAYEDSVRRDIRRAQLVDSIAVGAAPPEVMVRHLLRHEEQERTAEAVTVSADSLIPPDPDETTLQAYFTAHRDSYMSPEYRRIAAVIIRPADLLESVDVSEEDIRAEYDDRVDEFVTPTRRAVDQMTFDDREAAESAAARVVSGEDFYALGAELLDLAQADMDRGVLAAGDFVSEALGAAAFAVPVGQSTAPVETPFGWAIARVREEFPGENRDFESVADTLRFERKIVLAQNVAIDLGDEFEDERAGGATLEEAARAVGVSVSAIGPIDRQGRLGFDAADGAPPVVDFLNRAFAATQGEESALHDTDDGTYYAFRVDSVTPPAEKPLHEVRDEAVADWRANWRRERAVERATTIAERLRAGESAAAVAAETGAAMLAAGPFRRDAPTAGDGLGQAFVRAVFALEPDAVSDPVVEGGRVHVARLLEIVDVADADADQDAGQRIAERLLAAYVGDVVTGYTDVLYRRHDVSVNRAAIERYFEN